MQKKTGTAQVSGAAESASGEAFISLEGVRRVYAIFIDHTGQPATTDVAVTDPQSGAVFAKSNSGTDAMFYPRAAATKSDGTASTLTEVAPLAESLQVAVAQGSQGSVKVTAYVE